MSGPVPNEYTTMFAPSPPVIRSIRIDTSLSEVNCERRLQFRLMGVPETTDGPRKRRPDEESIWTRPDRGTRGPRPEHSRAEIAAAAIALADSGGLAAATMRAVAAELGTAAGSLYRYLSSRDDLLDLMVDAALAELP